MNGGRFEIVLVAAGIVLFLTLVGLVVFALLRQQRLEMERAQARQAELLRRAEQAVPGRARIISARLVTTSQREAALLSVALQLEVRPQDKYPYLASAVWLVEASSMASLQAGSEISIRIDQKDEQIVYPNMGGARYVGKF